MKCLRSKRDSARTIISKIPHEKLQSDIVFKNPHKTKPLSVIFYETLHNLLKEDTADDFRRFICTLWLLQAGKDKLCEFLPISLAVFLWFI